MSVLPPARGEAPYRVALVCLGNICRSPMADVVLSARVADAGLDDRVAVVSAGTGDWHVGGPMDRRAAALLTTHGYDASRHRAQQVRRDWLAGPDAVDVVLAMDADNRGDLEGLLDGAAPDGRLLMFRDFDPRAASAADRDVPDPYYGGDDGFSRVLAIVERTSDALVRELARVVGAAR